MVNNMHLRLKRFFASQDGAVTVDWVMLTSLVVIMAISLISLLYDGTHSAADNISDYIANTKVGD